MISFPIPNGTFNLRAAAIIRRGEKILWHRADFEHFWTLPGGRLDPDEDSKTGLKREIMEELEVECEVGVYLGVIENFYRFKEKQFHEIGFYYAVDGSYFDYLKEEFSIQEGHNLLHFKWMDLSQLKNEIIRPLKVLEIEKDVVQHIVERGEVY